MSVLRKPDRPLIAFVIYLVLFNAVWIGWVYLLYPRLRTLGEASLQYALVNMGLRSLIWVLPVFLYLRYVDHASPTQYLKLKQYWLRGLLAAFVFTSLNFLLFVAQRGLPHPSMRSVTWNSILGTSLMIGFVEEIPYRGFIFQKLNERFSLLTATLLSSLLFLGIHLPGWISLHLLTARNVIFVFVFGVVMVVVFRYSKSLWGPIVSHSLNDFLSAVLFHT